MGFFDVWGRGSEGFELFDLTHLFWLLVTCAAAVALCVGQHRLPMEKRKGLRRAVGLTLIALQLVRAGVLMALGEYDLGYLPLHLCGMAVYIEAFDCLVPNRFTHELCYAVCMPGALMALVFPNWTYLPFFNFLHIACFAIHVLLVVYPLTVLTGGDFRPSVKRLPFCFLFLAAVSLPVHLFNKANGTNYMFLEQAPKGSPLEWFEGVFGTPGYLLGVPMIMLALWSVMYAPFVVGDVRRKRAAKKLAQPKEGEA